jgi:hypothetical protein
MRSQIVHTHFSYRVHEFESESCIAICHVHKTGNKAIITGALGKHLLTNLVADLLEGSLKEMGIISLEGHVTDEVCTYIKAIERFTKNGKATFGESCFSDGINLTWVTIESINK